MSGHTMGPLEARAVISQNPVELCAATIHGPDGAELGCTWRRVDDPPGAEPLPGIDNALLWAAAPELAVALEALLRAESYLGEDAVPNCCHCAKLARTDPHEADCPVAVSFAALLKAGRLP